MTRQVRHVAALAAAATGWALVGLAVLTLALRLTHLDLWWTVVALIALSPWLYLLVALAGAGALVARRWRLAAAAGLLTVLTAVWVFPPYYPLHRAGSAPPGSVSLRLFDANVRFDNPSLTGIAAEIARDRPDVVTLEELTPPGILTLQASGVLSHYRWHLLAPAYQSASGLGVWSDVPLRGSSVWRAGTHPELRTQLVLPGRLVTVDVIHTDAPRPGLVATWHDELAAVATQASGQPRPLLVVGDFNATTEMAELQRVLHVGLKDAAVQTGNGWQMTWSRLVPVIPPLVRIDHVLYSPGLTVTGYHLGTGRGSDHRPVLTTIAVLPRPASGASP